MQTVTSAISTRPNSATSAITRPTFWPAVPSAGTDDCGVLVRRQLCAGLVVGLLDRLRAHAAMRSLLNVIAGRCSQYTIVPMSGCVDVAGADAPPSTNAPLW